MFTPRDYQLKAHNEIVEGFKQNLKLLLLMSTGAGKSKTIISFIYKYKKFFNFILVVRRRGLVIQLEDDLKSFDLDYGVFMAGHNLYYPEKTIQLGSIDTLANRELPHLTENRDLILIIDEADESNADQYQELINTYLNRGVSRTFLLGMTATAFDAALPHFDKVIQPITANELKNKKMLVDYRYFIPAIKNFENIKIEKGEFNSRDIERVFNSPNEIKLNFEAWLKFGEDRQTVIFCTNQDHAANFAKYINNYYGFINAVAVDANTLDVDRKKYYQDFKEQKIKFLVNVRLITRGTDIPEIGCILDSAPTLSVNLHIQKLGRGSRPNKLYADCIVIDIANNCVHNGHFYKERKVNLKEVKKRTKADLIEHLRICKSCFRGADPLDFGTKNTCPFCGFYNGRVVHKKLSKAKEKALFLQNASPEQIEQLEMINLFKKELWKINNLSYMKYPKDIARAKAYRVLINKYGIEKVVKIKNAIDLPDSMIQFYSSVKRGSL